MNYDRAFFDAGIDRAGTQSVKWAARGIMQEGMVPLWVADMDFACARPIVDALRARAEHSCYGYTFPSSEDARALIGFWARRHKLALKPEYLVMMPTVVAGLRACVQTMTQPGDGVIIQSPVYGPFIDAVRESGRMMLDAGLKHDEHGRYTMDYEAIERHLVKGARLMILCNPHNPVCRAWTQEELRALLSLLNRYKARLVSDEIHADFVYSPKEFVPVLSLPEAREDTVMLVAASKTFNIAGLQQATAICRDKDVAAMLTRYLERSGAHSGNIFALAGTRAAYLHCDDWLDGLMQYLLENQEALRNLLADLLPHAILSPMEATYLAWVDIRAYDTPNCELGSRCKKHGVALTDGQFFGVSTGEGFMRINYGCPKGQLLEGVQRFAHAVKEG
ncbi:MAG TPA: PatB family C-S lyase [Clostridia bacterium]|nr:PatB family C-S lyase [Clostridia bacterium]